MTGAGGRSILPRRSVEEDRGWLGTGFGRSDRIQDISAEAIVHSSCFTHQIWEMPEAKRQLACSLFRWFAFDCIAIQSSHKPGPIGPRFAMDKQRFWRRS